MRSFILIFVPIALFIILLYSIIFCLSEKSRVLSSSNELYRNKHINPPIRIIEEKDIITYRRKIPLIRFPGGYFSGLFLITFVGILIYYIYMFFFGNIFENITLVSSSTLTVKSGFKDIELIVYIGFYSLRNFECSDSQVSIANSKLLQTKDLYINQETSYN